MANIALVSILCRDHPGLIAAIAGRLFDIGANLGDTTFAVLGGAAEFNSVCELPDEVLLFSESPTLQWNVVFESRERVAARWLAGRDRWQPYVDRVDAALSVFVDMS